MPIVGLAVYGICMVGACGAAEAKAQGGSHRTAAQIMADYHTTVASLPRFPLEVRLDPRYKEQMKREFGGLDQRLVDLITELQAVNPADAAKLRTHKCLLLVHLALYGNADALKSLTDSSNSAVPAEALFGKVGLMAIKWWSSADAATQQDIVTQFQALAKANPDDDLLVSAALTMARYFSNSDDLSNTLRDIVDHDLKGHAAVKYHKQPFKIGRPFTISVNTINGPAVSTVAWKGKVVVVDFWATWCPPCRAALPGLIKLYQENHPKGLEILGVSNDSSLPDLKRFLAGNKEMVWPESFNPTGANGWNALSGKMEVTAIPTSFIIDRDGILRDIEVAFLKEDLVKKLLEQSAKSSPPASAGTQGVAETQAGAASAAANAATSPAVAPSPSDPKANALLSLAKSYIATKRTEVARAKLKELLQKYPDSEAAKKAKDLLGQLDGQ
jgi:thiol-disulfide isomerase/thioredoxin